MRKINLFLCGLMFFGCASFTDLRLFNDFDRVAKSYESAISSEDFEMAAGFLSKQKSRKKAVLPDKLFLKKIKITSYELLNREMNNEKFMVEQTVEIKYYNTNTFIEKAVQDDQIWIYESDSWQLSTGLPVFK